jgi:hypothetical protein
LVVIPILGWTGEADRYDEPTASTLIEEMMVPGPWPATRQSDVYAVAKSRATFRRFAEWLGMRNSAEFYLKSSRARLKPPLIRGTGVKLQQRMVHI